MLSARCSPQKDSLAPPAATDELPQWPIEEQGTRVSGTARLRFVLVCFALVVLARSALGADVPFLTGRVVDNAEILKPATRDAISAKLKAHEQATGDQIAILTLPTLDGEPIEEYAVKVFENWKLGQKGKDNGVLVVVVPQDRAMRIEVGYGLEGVLTDVATSRIIRNVMTPAFKSWRFRQGRHGRRHRDRGAARRHEQRRRGERDIAFVRTAACCNSMHPNLPWPERILFGVFIFGIIGLFTFIGIITPGVGWFLYVFLIPFWAMFPIDHRRRTRRAHPARRIRPAYPIAKLLLARSDWYKKAAQDLKSKGTRERRWLHLQQRRELLGVLVGRERLLGRGR